MSFGTWVREKLLEAGREGVTVSDLHHERLEHGVGWIDDTAIYKRGTYNSFARYFHWFKQLGFVESVGTEPSTTKGSDTKPNKEYEDRHYYRISAKGRRAPIKDWADPIEAVTGISAYERLKKYRPSTGRPRGRPPRVPPL